MNALHDPLEVHRAWIETARGAIAEDPESIAGFFAELSTLIDDAPLLENDPTALHSGTVADLVRAILIQALPYRRSALHESLSALYTLGDAHQKAGVLRALTLVDIPLGDPGIAGRAVPLVIAGLNSDNPELVAASMSRYAADWLTTSQFRRGIERCLELGVPLAVVEGLDERWDRTLATMVAQALATRAELEVSDREWDLLQRYPDIVDYHHLIRPTMTIDLRDNAIEVDWEREFDLGVLAHLE